jgi:alkaline phosphatase
MIRQTKGYLKYKTIDSEIELDIDHYKVGSSRTYSTNSLVTDSAAGATCFSCAQKTYNGAIGVLSDKTWCPTVLEAAKLVKMKTGLVATSRITHATPASFASHVPNRDQEEDIAVHLLQNRVDVMFGGGRKMFSSRKDKRDLVEEFKKNGYSFVENEAQLSALGAKDNVPVLGLFSSSHMSFKIDRDNGRSPGQPGLLQMAEKAIQLLSRAVDSDSDSDGFFLLIEGSRIDQGEHQNDPVAAVFDGIEYDDVWSYVVEWAKSRDDTLVVSTSDHATGGLSLNYGDSKSYAWYPHVFFSASASAEYMQKYRLANPGTTVAQLYEKFTSFSEPVTREEIELVEQKIAAGGDEYNEMIALAKPISKRARVAWTTKGHSGEDVHIYCYAPESKACDPLRGVVQNTQVGQVLADSLGINADLLDRVKKEIFPKLTNFDSNAPASFMHAGSVFDVPETLE